jgi:4-aminobutyrate aminotransferase-like enzyme
LSEPIVEYAERLLATCPPGLGHVLFTCTGSEANDLAIRIARHATGGSSIIATTYAYHGATVATAAISPAAGGVGVVGNVNRLIDPPATYPPSAVGAARFVAGLRAALEDLRGNGLSPAALLIDTAFSSDGIYFPPAEVLREAASLVRGAGGLLIADEVQTGFGRLGTGMWGFDRAGLEPDIVTLGKPMGDGHPMGAAIVRPELVRRFSTDTGYFNTFGGNPVSAAVGSAVLDVIERENLIDNAREVGAYLRAQLKSVAAGHPLIGDVRGQGLYVGVELVREGDSNLPAAAEAAALVNELAARGILVGRCGPAGNVLKIRPPLVFSRANAAQVVGAIDTVLSGWKSHV